MKHRRPQQLLLMLLTLPLMLLTMLPRRPFYYFRYSALLVGILYVATSAGKHNLISLISPLLFRKTSLK